MEQSKVFFFQQSCGDAATEISSYKHNLAFRHILAHGFEISLARETFLETYRFLDQGEVPFRVLSYFRDYEDGIVIKLPPLRRKSIKHHNDPRHFQIYEVQGDSWFEDLQVTLTSAAPRTG